MKPNLICKEFHAKGAIDDVAGGPLEAGVLDVYERWAKGVVVLELHQETNVVQALVSLQPLHVLNDTTSPNAQQSRGHDAQPTQGIRERPCLHHEQTATIALKLRHYSRTDIGTVWQTHGHQGSQMPSGNNDTTKSKDN